MLSVMNICAIRIYIAVILKLVAYTEYVAAANCCGINIIMEFIIIICS